MVLATANFGDFSNDLLVGNFGNGRINAYNPNTGVFLGTLSERPGRPLVSCAQVKNARGFVPTG